MSVLAGIHYGCTQDVIYPGEGSMCTLEKVEIHCFGMNCPIDIKTIPKKKKCKKAMAV